MSTSCVPSLTPLMHLLQKDMERVNTLIFSHMNSHVSLIPEITRYLVTSGGKRLRPLLALASALLCGYQGEKHIQLATCVEFIHTATLLHDDVVDRSLLRRGPPTAHTLWGPQASVLVGDFLLSRAFHLMMLMNNTEAMGVLCQTACQIAEGEILQLSLTRQLNTGVEDYMKMITAKTACLFQSSCEGGGILAEAPVEQQAALKDYGLNLGIAFQLVDDFLDYTADTKDLGKKIFQDFEEKKITLPVLLAYAEGTAEEKKFWENIFHSEAHSKHIEKVLKLMEKQESLKKTKQLADAYGENAKKSLRVFPHSPLREALIETAAFAVHRGA